MESMPHTTTLSDNQIAVIRYLYAHRQSTAHELIRDLGLSAPTITQCLRTLRSRGIVTQGELRQSTGGRKARTYDFNPNHLLL